MAVSQGIEELLAAKLRDARRKRRLTLNEFGEMRDFRVHVIEN